MSQFSDAFDIANVAFGGVTAETFTVARGGNTGTYTAISIDDLSAATVAQPGGMRGENRVNIFITRAVLTASAIEDGTILVTRNKRVEVSQISDDGDNTLMLICETAGVKF